MIEVGPAPEHVLALPEGSCLSQFNRAGVLEAADVHVALRLCRLAGEADGEVALAAALAVRAPRYGHVLVDLASVADSVAALEEAGLAPAEGELPWPAPAEWLRAVAASPLVGSKEDEPAPLRLQGTHLYLDRHWREERYVARALLERSGATGADVDEEALGRGVSEIFGVHGAGAGHEQVEAAELVVRRRLALVAGGPGTGKTTTVARALALLHGQASARGTRPPLIALSAPTGKAAARLTQALHREATNGVLSADVRQWLLRLGASTVHRLLGRQPGTSTRPRYDRFNQLPHDVVVVDETSMMSLSLMASLLQALRPSARLVLVGDPEQLASVEAGAVLGDLVGPVLRPDGRTSTLNASTAVLRANYRFGGPLAALAEAANRGKADEAVRVLRSDGQTGGTDGYGGPTLRWLDVDGAEAGEDALTSWRQMLTEAVSRVGRAAAREGPAAALGAVTGFVTLCAHREGPWGASTWNAMAFEWLSSQGMVPSTTAAEVPPTGADVEAQWYAGRPVIVTANDYSLGLFNGDLGVTVRRPKGALAVAFQKPQGVSLVSPYRLSAVATAYALTVHRAQGSEFDHVAVVLPPPGSQVLTRELLYTAITRARKGLLLVGREESVRAALLRPVQRASGLAERVWAPA